MENPPVDEGKTIAIISYITFIGLIIAFVMNSEKKNAFAAYHIRQSLGITLCYVIVWILASLLYIPILYFILYLALFVLVILGLVAAAQGEMKPVPVVGPMFQDWFKGI